MTKTEFYKWRKKAELTQKQAALEIGKTTRQVQKYEAGTVTPNRGDVVILMIKANECLKNIQKYLKKCVD